MLRLLALWKKEVLALARDVHGLAVLFVMPAAFIVIMSLALSEALKDETGRLTEFAVLAADGAGLAERVARRLAGDGFRGVPPPADEAAARAGVRHGRPALVLLLPRDFERGLREPPDGSNPAQTLTLLVDPALPPVQLALFRHRVLGAALALRLSGALRVPGNPELSSAFDLKQAATLRIEAVGSPRAGRPSSVQQNVPAWLIFGMFFVVMPISSLFIVERREGTLARLASLQVPFSLLLLGKVAPYFAINLGQAALMLAAGRTLVPWLGGDALALPARWDLLAAVTASTSLAAIGWGLLVAACARTMEQATVIGGVGNILAAAIGGIMVPRFVMPDTLQFWVDLSPMAWALDGFHTVLLRQGEAADLLAPCFKLLVLAAALFSLAIWAQRRRRTAITA